MNVVTNAKYDEYMGGIVGHIREKHIYRKLQTYAKFWGISWLPCVFSTSVELDMRNVRPSVCLYVRELWPNCLILLVFPLYGTFYRYCGCLDWKKKFICPTPRCWRADFLFFSCFLGDTLGRRFWPILGVLIFIFAFMASMRNSPGGKFFVWPDFHFLALGMGPKLVPDQNFEKFQFLFLFFVRFIILNQVKQ